MKIFVTGGAGFIGSHVTEFFRNKGNEVIVFDNLSRAKLLEKDSITARYNWDFLKRLGGINLIKGDITDIGQLEQATKDVDVIIHTAAQTAITRSVNNPKTDFKVNALGTFNVLEAARRNDIKTVVYCSTSKVYGDNVNKINLVKSKNKYYFFGEFKNGIPENYGIDLCNHTPYGCSKLTGDLYTQDYGRLYGLKTGVFRMSCIYGPRQFGFEDQGWVSWFTIATILGRPLTIYGNGKQVRDVLYVSDLVELFDKFVNTNVKQGVYNAGGGPEKTISLLEFIELLKKLTGKSSKLNFSDWRPSDQKFYISDISKAKKELNWKPKISPEKGFKKLVDWIEKNKMYFLKINKKYFL